MIHKKSEHHLAYCWLPFETSYQIWKENWKYRTSRRQREFQHEPFEWNGQNCDCDDFEESNSPLPPSRLQLKHLQLLEQAECEGRNKLPFCDKGVQTSESCGQLFFPEKGVQTSLSNFEHLEDTQEQPKHKELIHQASSDSKKCTSKNRPVTARTRKDRPKSPFAPYGWADNCSEMSGKRTFNVKASTRNIHPSAVRAKRQIESLNSTSIQPQIITFSSKVVEGTSELPEKIPATFKNPQENFPQKFRDVPLEKPSTSNFGSAQFVRDKFHPVASNSSAVFIKLDYDQKWLTGCKKKF